MTDKIFIDTFLTCECSQFTSHKRNQGSPNRSVDVHTNVVTALAVLDENAVAIKLGIAEVSSRRL